MIIFQSTLPRRERPSQQINLWASRIFQSTLPRRERLMMDIQTIKMMIFQSTLPRRERHKTIITACCISTFQSTLPRRERPYAPKKHYHLWNFNPRSREGSDDSLKDIKKEEKEISIHAPAKGATSQLLTLYHCPAFQSTLPRRERLDVEHFGIELFKFQSTLPRRERRIILRYTLQK